MKKQLDIKKLLLLNMPYILMGLFATNFGEAWRMAVGADASAKMLSFFSTLPVALASWWPSLHPLDLLVGLCCGAGLRLAVYLKSKNAKKYRHGMEYGSARWGTHEDIAPYIDPVFQNNVILTKTESSSFIYRLSASFSGMRSGTGVSGTGREVPKDYIYPLLYGSDHAEAWTDTRSEAEKSDL